MYSTVRMFAEFLLFVGFLLHYSSQSDLLAWLFLTPTMVLPNPSLLCNESLDSSLSHARGRVILSSGNPLQIGSYKVSLVFAILIIVHRAWGKELFFRFPLVCWSLLNTPEASCGSITSRLNSFLHFTLYQISMTCQKHTTKGPETKQTIKQNSTKSVPAILTKVHG